MGYEIDLYFPEHKLSVEVDEKGCKGRDKSKEIERQKAIEKELDCKFIRIILMKKNLMWIFILDKYKITLLNQLKIFGRQDSKWLLELEFKSYHSIKYDNKIYCHHYKTYKLIV